MTSEMPTNGTAWILKVCFKQGPSDTSNSSNIPTISDRKQTLYYADTFYLSVYSVPPSDLSYIIYSRTKRTPLRQFRRLTQTPLRQSRGLTQTPILQKHDLLRTPLRIMRKWLHTPFRLNQKWISHLEIVEVLVPTLSMLSHQGIQTQ